MTYNNKKIVNDFATQGDPMSTEAGKEHKNIRLLIQIYSN